MNKKEIQKKYNEKIRLIIKYNEYYYNESSSLVPDKDYDELKKDILLLEKKYSFLNSKKSPSKIIIFFFKSSYSLSFTSGLLAS